MQLRAWEGCTKPHGICRIKARLRSAHSIYQCVATAALQGLLISCIVLRDWIEVPRDSRRDSERFPGEVFRAVPARLLRCPVSLIYNKRQITKPCLFSSLCKTILYLPFLIRFLNCSFRTFSRETEKARRRCVHLCGSRPCAYAYAEWSQFNLPILFGHPCYHRELQFLKLLFMTRVAIPPQILKGGATFPTMERPTDTILRRFSRVVDSSLMSFFGAIAERVAVRPYAVITVMTLLSLLAGAGIIRIKVLTDEEKLYTPQGTQGFTDQVGSGPYNTSTPILYQI